MSFLMTLARPDIARDMSNAGANIPNLAGLANAANAKLMEDQVKTMQGIVVGIKSGMDAVISDLAGKDLGLVRQLEANAKRRAALSRANQYLNEMNNPAPLAAELNMLGLFDLESQKDLALFPEIAKIPDEWTPAPPATATTSTSA